MLLATLVACGKDDGDDTGDGQGTVSTNDTVRYDQYGQQTYDDPTAGLNYNGKTINFLVRSGDQYLREWTSPTGEPQTSVDWKIYERNVIVYPADHHGFCDNLLLVPNARDRLARKLYLTKVYTRRIYLSAEGICLNFFNARSRFNFHIVFANDTLFVQIFRNTTDCITARGRFFTILVENTHFCIGNC